MDKIKIALKRVLNTLMWVVLFIFALTVLLLTPVAFIYNLIRLFWKSKIGTGIDALNYELRTVCYTLDVLGNVTLFNWIDHWKDRPEYGISGQTISEVLYYRSISNTLDFKDRVIYKAIIVLDKKHFHIFAESKK